MTAGAEMINACTADRGSVYTMSDKPQVKIRIGIVGISSHSADFTQIINGEFQKGDYADCRVTAIFQPQERPDLALRPDQHRRYTETLNKFEVKFVDSTAKLLEEVDVVMLLTNDGRPHLEQIIPILKAGKAVYLDKPIADTFSNVRAIYQAAHQYDVPVYSSSALRYVQGLSAIKEGIMVGPVLGAEVYGPAPIQKEHVDLFWDGIHAVEMLYSIMGKGCQTVVRTHSRDVDVVTATWEDGRIGLFRGLRSGKISFGGTVFGKSSIVPIPKFEGYRGLIISILEFFRTKKLPVPVSETLEIYAFMEAAEESKRLGGSPVSVQKVLRSVRE